MATRGEAPIYGNKMKWNIKFTGDTTEYELNGVASHDTSGGDAPTTEVRTHVGVYTQTGVAPLPSTSVEISVFNPITTVWQKLVAARGSSVQIKWSTEKRTVLAGSTALGTMAIAQTDADTTTATATLTAGTTALSLEDREDIVPGLALVITDKSYVIDTIDSGTTMTVKRAASGAAISATASWEIVVPSIGRDYHSATVGQVGNESMPSDGVMSSTVVFNPNSTPPAISVLDPALG